MKSFANDIIRFMLRLGASMWLARHLLQSLPKNFVGIIGNAEDFSNYTFGNYDIVFPAKYH